MNNDKIHCDKHGLQSYGIVCKHLTIDSSELGFHQQKVGDDKPEAWCNICHERWQKRNHSEEVQEMWENECDFKIVCATCYEAILLKNNVPYNIDLNIYSTSEIFDQHLLKKYNQFVNFQTPNYLPNSYINFLKNGSTQLISIECKIMDFEDGKKINEQVNSLDEWIFATSKGKEYWSFSKNNTIIYYEYINENLIPKNLKISFEEWLQLAFLLNKLDKIQEKYLVTISLQKKLQQSLAKINPVLNKYFEDII